ncbi:MAG: hypothetical protein JW795_15945 [Chitinivibrionales bacterium]|nr:hypothetical protein [Chitinivibrionales bacterium]
MRRFEPSVVDTTDGSSMLHYSSQSDLCRSINSIVLQPDQSGITSVVIRAIACP